MTATQTKQKRVGVPSSYADILCHSGPNHATYRYYNKSESFCLEFVGTHIPMVTNRNYLRVIQEVFALRVPCGWHPSKKLCARRKTPNIAE
jgi:hypothetical protein